MPSPAQNDERYKQICEDLRFYGDMRFKQLTLWSVGIGFILNVLFGKDAQNLDAARVGWWVAAGFYWTALIWVMEVRSTMHYITRMKMRKKLEPSMPDKPLGSWRVVNATNAVWLLFLASTIAFLNQLRKLWGFSSSGLIVAIVTFFVLVMFTGINYGPLLRHAVKDHPVTSAGQPGERADSEDHTQR